MLPLRISGFRGCLVEEEPESVVKALKSCRRSRPIDSGKSELDALEILLDNRNGTSEFGEEEAWNDLLKVRKITEVTLNVTIELKALAQLEVNMEGRVCFGALLEMFKDPHLDW